MRGDRISVRDPECHSLASIEDRYALVERLGAGAMGIVFRGEDLALRRPVAIKMIDPKHAGDPAFVAMFKAEARALARIRHENVVQVYAFGLHRDSFYLVMEFVAGTDLDTLIEKTVASGRPFDAENGVAIIRRVGLGLAAAHAQGLVHRDIKPSNILVEDDTARPVLIDFGLADASSAVVEQCMTMGTPEYMAPEQACGLALTPRADIYALACTTFELLTARPLFADEDVVQLMTAHAARPAPALSTIRPELAPLDDVLLRALSKDPAKRQDTVLAFVDELERAVRRISRRSLAAPVSASRAIARPRVRVLVFERDEGIRRQLMNVIERTLRSAGDEAIIECAASAVQFAELVDGVTPDIVVVDDESADGAIATVLDMIRADVSPEVLVLRESFDTLGRGGLRLRELPKPLNGQVVASVISKMAVSIAERRTRRDRSSG